MVRCHLSCDTDGIDRRFEPTVGSDGGKGVDGGTLAPRFVKGNRHIRVINRLVCMHCS